MTSSLLAWPSLVTSISFTGAVLFSTKASGECVAVDMYDREAAQGRPCVFSRRCNETGTSPNGVLTYASKYENIAACCDEIELNHVKTQPQWGPKEPLDRDW